MCSSCFDKGNIMLTVTKNITPTFGLALFSCAFSAVAESGTETSSQNSKSLNDQGWFAVVNKTQEEQPHWMTPLVTITPRLEEEYRYDQTQEYKPGDTTLTNYGGGKGLELIPSENVETIIGQPGYLVQQTYTASHKTALTPNTITGWADETFLVKYRFLAANEEHGNYIVTGFLGLSVPTGNYPFTTGQTIVTPTLAVGKGWGSREQGMNVQSTFSASIPDGNQNVLGIPFTWNTSLQAHISNLLWPEIEASYTYWQSGLLAGKNQLIMTYGLILGRIPLEGRTKLILGIGYQDATATAFSTYSRGWITTARVAF